MTIQSDYEALKATTTAIGLIPVRVEGMVAERNIDGSIAAHTLTQVFLYTPSSMEVKVAMRCAQEPSFSFATVTEEQRMEVWIELYQQALCVVEMHNMGLS